MNTLQQRRLADELRHYMQLHDVQVEVLAERFEVDTQVLLRWLDKKMLHTGIGLKVSWLLEGRLPPKQAQAKRPTLTKNQRRQQAWVQFYHENFILKLNGIGIDEFLDNPAQYCRVDVLKPPATPVSETLILD